MINACDVGVRIGDKDLLAGVSFAIMPGEWVGVVGPNGAGKSTLLRTLVGLTQHTGQVFVAHADVRAMSAKELARIVAVVVQQPVIPQGIVVADYVLLGRSPHLGLLQRETRHDRARVSQVLELLALTEFSDRRMQTLSGGELQRVYLARALVQEPQVLLLDEPTSALDIGHQQEVLGLIDQIRQDSALTVVSTMHDLTMAGEYADRILLLHQGRILRDGPPEEVLEPHLLARTYGATLEVLPADPARGFSGPVVVPVRHRADLH
ncbi:ABC transporter ATP-binding protein [Propionibacteriaceae bacterium Y1685]|uniref:ABC transporter ATP-binding protein n=1 Tax=Microlunatus sp. Y1700 TaxID=3418487 RepID=UPI003B7FC575